MHFGSVTHTNTTENGLSWHQGCYVCAHSARQQPVREIMFMSFDTCSNMVPRCVQYHHSTPVTALEPATEPQKSTYSPPRIPIQPRTDAPRHADSRGTLEMSTITNQSSNKPQGKCQCSTLMPVQFTHLKKRLEVTSLTPSTRLLHKCNEKISNF